MAEGFAVVSYDVRGTGASGGVWEHPWSLHERIDSLEVLEWCARAPWSDGRALLVGLSYDATAALLTATLDHPSVVGICPRCPFFDLFDDVGFPGGVPLTSFPREWAAFGRRLDERRMGPLRCLFGHTPVFVEARSPLADTLAGEVAGDECLPGKSSPSDHHHPAHVAARDIGLREVRMLKSKARDRAKIHEGKRAARHGGTPGSGGDSATAADAAVVKQSAALHQRQNWHAATDLDVVRCADDPAPSSQLAPFEAGSPCRHARRLATLALPVRVDTGLLDLTVVGSQATFWWAARGPGSELVAGPWGHGGFIAMHQGTGGAVAGVAANAVAGAKPRRIPSVRPAWSRFPHELALARWARSCVDKHASDINNDRHPPAWLSSEAARARVAWALGTAECESLPPPPPCGVAAQRRRRVQTHVDIVGSGDVQVDDVCDDTEGNLRTLPPHAEDRRVVCYIMAPTAADDRDRARKAKADRARGRTARRGWPSGEGSAGGASGWRELPAADGLDSSISVDLAVDVSRRALRLGPGPEEESVVRHLPMNVRGTRVRVDRIAAVAPPVRKISPRLGEELVSPRGGRLVLASAPLDAPLIVVGRPQVRLRLRFPPGTRDAALHVYLLDAAPAWSWTAPCWRMRGDTERVLRHAFVADGSLRLAHRASQVGPPEPGHRAEGRWTPSSNPFRTFHREDASPLDDDTDVWVDVPLRTCAHVFSPGHRIVLALAGAEPRHHAGGLGHEWVIKEDGDGSVVTDGEDGATLSAWFAGERLRAKTSLGSMQISGRARSQYGHVAMLSIAEGLRGNRGASSPATSAAWIDVVSGGREGDGADGPRLRLPVLGERGKKPATA